MNALGYLIGAGSMSLGIEQAGFTVREIWETPGYGKNAQTWALNRPDLPVNLLDLDWQSEHFARYRGVGLDLIYGNPPCGGLSAMTCSRIESPTNNCMRQWIRMVAQAQPRMILMENAFQLATDRIKPLLDDLTSVLDQWGYWWWTWLFYSYQIGTPQIRRRMFLCATQQEPKNSQYLTLHDLPDQRLKTNTPCGPYLADLVGVAPTTEWALTQSGNYVAQHTYDKPELYAERNKVIQENYEQIQKRVKTSKDLEIAQAKYDADPDNRDNQKRLKKAQDLLWPDAPKWFGGMSMHRPSVIKWESAAPAIIGFFKFVHPIDHRLLTMREMARLMGYPDKWNFHELNPSLIAQGIPVNSARWAADRMLRALGER